MARLFITPREVDLINDLHKEIIKDVIGQVIYLFPISTIKSQVHDVYEESPEKIFENPVKLDARVKWIPEDTHTNVFGHEETSQVEVYVSTRDLIDKNVAIDEGDFFSFGTQFYEVTSLKTTHIIYGQVEYEGGIRLIGRVSRKGNFLSKVFGPTEEKYADPDATQRQFIQQRGFEENTEGQTNDVRSLQQKGVLDPPISEPAEVSPRGDPSGGKSSFYDEQD